MKVASYRVGGRLTWGVVTGDSVSDLGADGPVTLDDALKTGAPVRDREDAPRHALSDIEFAVPVADPEKILCVGRNYKDHVAEGKNKELPGHPGFFARNRLSLTPHDGPILRPGVSDNLDYEGELGIVIGRSARNLTRETALDCVFGYTCFNDGTLRDFQDKYSALVGKNFPSTGGLGPWVVTADEIGDPSGLTLETRLNGEVMQSSSTDRMIFDVQTILCFVSVFTELRPGDIVVTGTPEGVGKARTPPVWMKPGDTVEVEIEKIGTLRNVIRQE
ncbi:5-carboxymethyl-2-hydroxymuconate isomerase [Primorskyibacter flagellatus]|uniref:5-carboxymethyl-2-hydroxymuconate isomerase n=1 Tax=Primorskyibacter flagellatus TaxID=1387277 RepID=A0A917EKQ4_9RHOB|nr:fumarylacetoacetate hydrolase family protein [Primorskyibacter flagellatus]GGE50071.1 5-carboxymethyl-2-hydroxymuconate isomerase [Primorskyibacter flagellatus]